ELVRSGDRAVGRAAGILEEVERLEHVATLGDPLDVDRSRLRRLVRCGAVDELAVAREHRAGGQDARAAAVVALTEVGDLEALLALAPGERDAFARSREVEQVHAAACSCEEGLAEGHDLEGGRGERKTILEELRRVLAVTKDIHVD